MDILYVIGPDSGHDNRELRWSLRSVAKFATGVDRVVVSGYPPDWLSDEVCKVNVPKLPTEKHKFAHILRQVFNAIDGGWVSGEFLLSSDDHFYTRPVDVNQTPFWMKRNEIWAPGEERGGYNYRKDMAVTRALLVQGGYPIVMSNVHANCRLDAKDAPEVKALIASDKATAAAKEYGYDATLLFQNVRAKRAAIQFVPRVGRDWKCHGYRQEAIASGQFSISDRAFADPAFVTYMERTFGEPCKYEKQTEGGAQ